MSDKNLTVKEIVRPIEELAPPVFQESYDNAGLICGQRNQAVTGVLISLDVTEDIVNEAINNNCNLIVAHHPIVFGGLKSLTGKNYVERTVILAIKNNIAIYAAHTNLDNVPDGVNTKICEKLGLQDCRFLQTRKGELQKLVTFVPTDHADKVRSALFAAGAGHIGNYDSCSYQTGGKGTFRAQDAANPYVGEKGKLHFEEELRVETIYPRHLKSHIISALLNAHPYEEVAYDIYALENDFPNAGAGMVGMLETPMDETEFLQLLKMTFNSGVIRHTALLNSPIQKVALCGGAGSFLLKDAIRAGAQIFISGDFSYHKFFDAENRIIIADIGHFESEQFTIDVFYDLLTKKFPNFAVRKTNINTNPINYL